MNFIFNDNVRMLCLSCNVKKVGKLVRFKQKGQKQASFLAFHKCCQGCLLRGPRYISTRKARTNKLYIYRQCTYIVYKPDIEHQGDQPVNREKPFVYDC
jgi:hypothetical protein